MLPARFARLEADAQRTARAINDRRELLDWFLNARREMETQKAASVAQKEQEDAMLAASASTPILEVAPASKRGLLSSSYAGGGEVSSRQGTPLNDLTAAAHAASLQPTYQGSPSSKLTAGKRGGILKSNSAGKIEGRERGMTPVGRPSMRTMPVSNVVTMHSRVDMAMAAAERNARQLTESRKGLDTFKELRAAMEEGKNKGQSGKFSMSAPMQASTYLPSKDGLNRLSYNSRVSFAQSYGSLMPLRDAVKEVPPPHPTHPTSSMANRLEACEHRAMWNHQIMGDNQLFLDDYRQLKHDCGMPGC